MIKPIQLASKAWLLRGISSLPGELRLAHDRLAFTAFGSGTAWAWQLRTLERDARRPGLAEQIDSGSKTLVFDIPLSQVEVNFPWYYFSGGLKLRSGDVRYRLSFGRPSNTRISNSAITELDEARTMRAAGKQWKAALTRTAGTIHQDGRH